jgi:hypothetical protein
MKPSLHDPILCQNILFDRGDVLVHLVDKFNDHVTATFAPPCVAVANPCCLKHGEYKINCSVVVSKWFAVDRIDMDLREPCKAGGIKLLFPDDIYRKLKQAADVSIISKVAVGNFHLVT